MQMEASMSVAREAGDAVLYLIAFAATLAAKRRAARLHRRGVASRATQQRDQVDIAVAPALRQQKAQHAKNHALNGSPDGASQRLIWRRRRRPACIDFRIHHDVRYR